ncbi:HNH endonuclease signature motif containing protein [Leclercia adecarboxylata]|uniref:HNH endonuclease signature motif containing protein n=1 Tax=Leclercia adecarboxylata TaxID=83655 RepID=UPI00124C2F03|nr:HNH endonuclease signature motif containing protein [Leclercia adecarboxylata]QFH49728.1 HNH endonuclease [Leclercia adecarboxylata]
MAINNFDAENLAKIPEFISYCPETGIFIRKKASNNRFKVGDVAGTVNQQGYVRIMMFGMGFQAHRLAFYFMTGSLPADGVEVDHINGLRGDNSWVNLRLVTHAVNMQNSRKPRHNTSGHPGVGYQKRSGKWYAKLSINGSTTHLGEFHDKNDAINAYLAAKEKYHEGFISDGTKAPLHEQKGLSDATNVSQLRR